MVIYCFGEQLVNSTIVDALSSANLAGGGDALMLFRVPSELQLCEHNSLLWAFYFIEDFNLSCFMFWFFITLISTK
jgi:hypothetical protein